MRKCIALVLGLVLLAMVPARVQAADKEVKKVQAAIDVMKEIMAIPEKGIPPALLHNAYGIAIIPGVIKVGFVIGGRYGTGVLLVRGKNGAWSDPSFISLTGGSLGWQIGAQSTDVILVFKNPRSVEGIMHGKFTLGADAGVAAGPVGRQVSGATDAQLRAEIYSYSRSRGLFAGVSLEGAVLRIDDDSNAAFYGRQGIQAAQILSGRGPAAPAPAPALKALLSRDSRAH